MKNAYRLAPAGEVDLTRSGALDSRTALQDPRWPTLVTHLAALRNQDRYAVRIVDADCGAGCLLLPALYHARRLGFTAIEGRGISGSNFLVKRARIVAALQPDPAIGIIFEVADMIDALRQEYDAPADIVLWHGAAAASDRHAALCILSRAGDRIIGDPTSITARPAAA